MYRSALKENNIPPRETLHCLHWEPRKVCDLSALEVMRLPNKCSSRTSGSLRMCVIFFIYIHNTVVHRRHANTFARTWHSRGCPSSSSERIKNLTHLVRNFNNIADAIMDRGSRRRVPDSVFDKPLPLKGRPEV